MTYKELAHKILDMGEDDLGQDVTVRANGEFYAMITLDYDYSGVLDAGHPYVDLDH